MLKQRRGLLSYHHTLHKIQYLEKKCTLYYHVQHQNIKVTSKKRGGEQNWRVLVNFYEMTRQELNRRVENIIVERGYGGVVKRF